MTSTASKLTGNPIPQVNFLRLVAQTLRLNPKRSPAKMLRPAKPASKKCGPAAGGRSHDVGPAIAAAVVLTVTVTVAGADPLKVTEPGETEHAASDGAPLQLRLTG
ncbi:MAG: hypothetical protein ACRD22_12470 [Terriglobia bacterium]